MAPLARGERLQVMLTDEELAALDDWRFDKRMPTRASAVRELLKRGLAAEGVVVAGGGGARGLRRLSPGGQRGGGGRATSAFSNRSKRRVGPLARAGGNRDRFPSTVYSTWG